MAWVRGDEMSWRSLCLDGRGAHCQVRALIRNGFVGVHHADVWVADHLRHAKEWAGNGTHNPWGEAPSKGFFFKTGGPTHLPPRGPPGRQFRGTHSIFPEKRLKNREKG